MGVRTALDTVVDGAVLVAAGTDFTGFVAPLGVGSHGFWQGAFVTRHVGDAQKRFGAGHGAGLADPYGLAGAGQELAVAV